MKKQPLPEIILLWSLTIIALLAFAELISKMAIWKTLDAQNWAAWVQAIGSIAAVFTAIFVMHRQNERAVAAEHKVLLRRQAGTYALVERGYRVSLMVEKHTQEIYDFADHFYAVIDPLDFEKTVSALSAISLHELDTFAISRGVQDMILWLHKLGPLIELHGSKKDVHYVFEGDDLTKAKFVCKKIKAARDAVKSSMEGLGYVPPDTEHWMFG